MQKVHSQISFSRRSALVSSNRLKMNFAFLLTLGSMFSNISAETYAYIVSSAEYYKVNYKRYFDNISFAYTALIKAGVKREKITVNYANVGDKTFRADSFVAFDPTNKIKGSARLTLSQLKVPAGYLMPKIDGPATDENIVRTFKLYSQSLRPNDKLIVFVSGHYGEAIETWREGIPVERGGFPFRRVSQLFEKIPLDVKLIYVNHGCFTGELMDPVSSNYYKWSGKKHCALWFSDKGVSIEKTPGMEWFWKQVAHKRDFYDIYLDTENFDLPHRMSSYSISTNQGDVNKQNECFDFWKD